MALTQRKIQVIKSELIADAVINVLEKEGYFNLWVRAEDRSKKNADGNIQVTFEKVNSSIEALNELHRLILKEIEEVV